MIITPPIVCHISAVRDDVLYLWKSVHISLVYFDGREVDRSNLMKLDGHVILRRVFLTHRDLLVPEESLRGRILARADCRLACG